MKKIFFIFLLFLCFFILNPGVVQAQYPQYQGCRMKASFGSSCPSTGYAISCKVNNIDYCCDLQGNCNGAIAKGVWVDPCATKPNTIPTAIGCVDFTSTTGITQTLLKFALGIGGGIAFLLMIIGSFMIMTSSGNPEKQQAGKEMITSAIMGLLLILLSVFILQLIGVKILAIPGFG